MLVGGLWAALWGRPLCAGPSCTSRAWLLIATSSGPQDRAACAGPSPPLETRHLMDTRWPAPCSPASLAQPALRALCGGPSRFARPLLTLPVAPGGPSLRPTGLTTNEHAAHQLPIGNVPVSDTACLRLSRHPSPRALPACCFPSSVRRHLLARLLMACLLPAAVTELLSCSYTLPSLSPALQCWGLQPTLALRQEALASGPTLGVLERAPRPACRQMGGSLATGLAPSQQPASLQIL